MASYTLFEPKSLDRSLVGDYPELKEFDEFKILKNKELLFVWYFANVTSPFAHINNKRERARAALTKVWGTDPPKSFKDQALTGQYSAKLRDAIERMSSFEPEVRNRAKSMMESAFSNYEKILKQEVNEGEDDKTVKQREEYVNLSVKIIKEVPSLVKQIESGYGIKDKNVSGTGEDDTNLMDDIREGD